MKALARGYVWWPKIEEAIENHVGLCEPCQQSRHAPPRAPVHPWEATTKPWSRLHIDYAGPFQGQMFFILVDSFSKWVEVKRLHAATAVSTIKAMREIFATHGIPDVVASDNGKQFTSDEFKYFLKSNGIRQALSAPYHPSSNGQAERVVQTTKNALKRIIHGSWNQRLTSFLLAQHNTPNATTGLSPAEILMKRRLKTVLDLLHPDLVADRTRRLEKAREENLTSGRLRSFANDDTVYVRNHAAGQPWIPSTVIERTGPLSYKAVSPDGKIIRCHIDQMRNRIVPTEEKHSAIDVPDPIETANPDSETSMETTTPENLGPVINRTPENKTELTTPRPRRNTQLPKRFKDYFM